MRKICLSFLLLLSISLNSQKLNDSTIIGTWRVSKILIHKKASSEEIEQYKALEQSFLNSSFSFKTDKHFDFNFEIKDMAFKNVHWKFDKKKEKLIIQEWKDRKSDKFLLIEIIIIEEEGSIFFALTETPFLLEVAKE
jgi:hypothetical protein